MSKRGLSTMRRRGQSRASLELEALSLDNRIKRTKLYAERFKLIRACASAALLIVGVVMLAKTGDFGAVVHLARRLLR